MLGPDEHAAVKAVLVDLASGRRVSARDIPTLLGVEVPLLQRIASDYPELKAFPLEQVDLAIHNGLNLYVNGILVGETDWEAMGTSSLAAERAFSLWQRPV